MCEFSGRLIAWLDRELVDENAIQVEGHVAHCAECRKAVAVYEEVSSAFLACCEEAMARAPRNPRYWGPAVGAVAAAAVIVVVIFFNRPRIEKLSAGLPPTPHAPAIAFEKLGPAAPVPLARTKRRHIPAPAHNDPQWVPGEQTIQVAIPADALFPPGAVPEGFSFIADVHFQQ
ncbi:MAG: zf-HC2 domain-containing protein [Bryobacterales bacterium]|nr:zf-HC2 domain-containing protein [Bryobacterales bacterium]